MFRKISYFFSKRKVKCYNFMNGNKETDKKKRGAVRRTIGREEIDDKRKNPLQEGGTENTVRKRRNLIWCQFNLHQLNCDFLHTSFCFLAGYSHPLLFLPFLSSISFQCYFFSCSSSMSFWAWRKKINNLEKNCFRFTV